MSGNGTIDRWVNNARAFVIGATSTAGEPAGRSGRPRAAIVAASDFPIDLPSLVGAAARDVYQIRTVAGLVPPSAGEDIDRSVGAALEFAVKIYGVRHIIVLAHPDCGLVRCLIDEDSPGAHAVLQGQFLPSWTALAASALSRVLHARLPDSERARVCCQEMVRVSFENLMTYQWVLDRVFSGGLDLHGWYVDERSGVLSHFDPETDSFVTDLPG